VSATNGAADCCSASGGPAGSHAPRGAPRWPDGDSRLPACTRPARAASHQHPAHQHHRV